MRIISTPFWAKLPLAQKLVLPFFVVSLCVFILSFFTVGNWFANSLEQNQRQDVVDFADRVHQDLQFEQQILENQIKLIADREALVQAVKRGDRATLLQTLLPLRTSLGIDWLAITNTQKELLLDLRSAKLGQGNLRTSALLGSIGASFSDLLDTEDGRQTLQAVSYPIRSAAGLLGEIAIARLVDQVLLQKIVKGSSKHVVVTRNGKVMAATLPSVRLAIDWNAALNSVRRVAIERQEYLTKSIVFDGTNNALVLTVLLEVSQLENAKRNLWSQLGIVFLLGTIVTALVGMAIAQAIVRPLRMVTNVARQVTRESNFNLRVPVQTEDEIGVVAITLNRLIQQVQQLLIEQESAKNQLEVYNQTLTQQVEERTQEIQLKNTDLQQTLVRLQAAQSQLVQSEKMSALGQLVAGIAHEINNPVNFIHGNLKHANAYAQDLLQIVELYQQDVPNPSLKIREATAEADLDYIKEDLPKLLSSMEVGTERIREIVLSLRTFSRLDEASYKVVNLHEGIDSTLMILQHRLKARDDRPAIAIVKAYGNIPPVECFAGQMNQVYMNLLANAIDALEDAVAAGNCPTPAIRIASAQEDNNVVVRIADNGMGMSEEIQNRLFDPFFTTKPVGKGTGMGLSICYQIVTERHGGSLACKSSPGEGTEFAIGIPIR